MANGAGDAVDPTLFRNALSSFATGITVITTEVNGEIRSMTANAFMSGSLEPPLCIVSVAKRARTHGMQIETGYFGVSILAQVRRNCASISPTIRLRIWNRCSIISAARPTIAADIVARHECGDHSIFVGRIV